MSILSRPGVQKHRRKAKWLHRNLPPQIDFPGVDSWMYGSECFADRTATASTHSDACRVVSGLWVHRVNLLTDLDIDSIQVDQSLQFRGQCVH